MRIWKNFTFYLFILLQVALTSALLGAMKPTELTTEFRSDPIGVGTKQPVFGWKLISTLSSARNLRQSGYRIIVATSPDQLVHHSGEVWDSGMIASQTYWQHAYQGPELHSHTTYFWQVQVWDGSDKPGPWSQVGRFTTALLSDEDWNAHWIAAEPDRAPSNQFLEGRGEVHASLPPPLPVFRHEFELKKPVASALLYVSGLGQYEIHLNGKDVTETVMNSGWTDYRKTVPYDTYDVKAFLHSKLNAFGVLLGNGMYNVEGVRGHYTKFIGSFGQPKCLVQLELRYTDGSSERVSSDSSWQTRSGPILYSSIYGGEAFDASALPLGWDLAGFRTKGWQPALEVQGPGGRLTAQQSAPLVVAETYPSIRTATPKPGITVYDFGVNMSGWPSISVRGASGSKVQLLAGELLKSDGTVTQRSAAATPEEPVLFSYRLRGGAVERWHPRFAYYSFRYVQVTTEPSSPEIGVAPKVLSVAGDFVHARAPVVGQFESSDELFNRIHNLIDRAVLSNLASVVTDCPSREKLGWLEQTYLNATTLMLNYDVTSLYEKMSHDISDAQLPDGMVPGIAPEFIAFVDQNGRSTQFRDSPEWGSAIILSPWSLYLLTGDERPLHENYSAMQRYVEYLDTRAVDGLLDYGLGDWYDVGPKEPGESQLTSKTVTATGVYFEDLRVLAQIATLLKHPDEAAGYTSRANKVRDAFNAKLFHPEISEYDRGSQTANALPLALGMVPPEYVQGVLQSLVNNIRDHRDHVTAGDVGFHYVVRALTDNGRSDVLAAMLSRKDSPSYGYQLSRGATTLTEAWDTNPLSSQNHFMLGHGEEWFYRGLAGLSVDMSKGAEAAILFHPTLVPGAGSAAASYQSPLGEVRISWKNSDQQVSIKVTVPAGAVAHIRLPPLPQTRSWQVDGRSVTPAVEDALSLGSGDYLFLAN